MNPLHYNKNETKETGMGLRVQEFIMSANIDDHSVSLIDTGESFMKMFARTQPELFNIYRKVPRKLKKKRELCVYLNGQYFVRKNKPFMLNRRIRNND